MRERIMKNKILSVLSILGLSGALFANTVVINPPMGNYVQTGYYSHFTTENDYPLNNGLGVVKLAEGGSSNLYWKTPAGNTLTVPGFGESVAQNPVSFTNNLQNAVSLIRYAGSPKVQELKFSNDGKQEVVTINPPKTIQGLESINAIASMYNNIYYNEDNSINLSKSNVSTLITYFYGSNKQVYKDMIFIAENGDRVVIKAPENTNGLMPMNAPNIPGIVVNRDGTYTINYIDSSAYSDDYYHLTIKPNGDVSSVIKSPIPH
jgi:hypothetical protein